MENEFKEIMESAHKLKKEFYEKHKDQKDLFKDNKFIKSTYFDEYLFH